MMPRYYTNEQLLDVLKKALGEPRKRAAWARAHNVRESTLSMVLSKERAITAKIAACLGFEKRTYYIKKRDDNGTP